MSSRIVIGDVHGCYKTLMALLKKLPEGIPITFAGDLIDRGNDSRKVVKHVIENGHDCVTGNHEDMMIQHVDETEDPQYKGQWSAFENNGGLRTLQSYMGYEEEMQVHVNWMRGLPVYLEYPEIKNAEGRHLVVSHSNVGNVWKYRNKEDKQAIFKQVTIWGRQNFEDNKEIYNVVGHTPQPDGPKIKSFYANVDTGACFYREFSEQYGVLTAIQFPEMIVYSQKNIENEFEDKNEEENKPEEKSSSEESKESSEGTSS